MIEELLKNYDVQRKNFDASETTFITIEELDTLVNRIRELEAKNADLKRQVTEAICYILSNEGASMIDCRTCFFVSSCEREPQQCEPNYEMCLRAVRKYIEDSGE